MATRSTAGPREESASEEHDGPRYALDPQLIEANGRVATTLLESRMCEASREKRKASQGTLASQFAALRKLIRDNCQRDAEYLHSQLPVMETAFRLLVIAPLEPVALSTLHGQIDELWSDSTWPRHISAEALGRVLGNDDYYGIVEVASEAQDKAKK